jgi:membrane-associated phospholipid phosphatase
MIALGSYWVVTEVGLKNALAPPDCRWCATNGFDDGIRHAFVPQGQLNMTGKSTADTVSNLTLIASPVLLMALDALYAWRAGGDWRDWLLDVTLMMEASFAAMAVNQTAKFIAGRERPFVSSLSPAMKANTDQPNDNDLSFFSGHATFTAAFAASAGAIALLRGYQHPWIAWLLGGALSITTGMLRLAADKHYFSDVATGWVVGAGIGLAVPLLFHDAGSNVSVAPGPNGVGVAARW